MKSVCVGGTGPQNEAIVWVELGLGMRPVCGPGYEANVWVDLGLKMRLVCGWG